jgi:hypothetical protein
MSAGNADGIHVTKQQGTCWMCNWKHWKEPHTKNQNEGEGN